LVRLLGLYPPAWQERYGEELSELLASEPITPLALAAVLWGALDAHLHPHLPTPGVLSLPGERLRLAALSVFGAFIGGLVAALFFVEAVDDHSFAHVMQTRPALQGLWMVLVAGAVVAGLSLLVGGLPIVWAVVRDARRRRSAAGRTLMIPPLALLVLLGCYGVEKGRHLAHVQWPGGVELTFDVFLHTLFILAAMVSMGAVCLAVLQSHITDRLFRWALAPALCGTLGLVVMLAAAVAWLVGARSAAPADFAQSAIGLGFVLLVGLLLIATVWAAQGVARGLATHTGRS
jgi:hypothetical protein